MENFIRTYPYLFLRSNHIIFYSIIPFVFWSILGSTKNVKVFLAQKTMYNIKFVAKPNLLAI